MRLTLVDHLLSEFAAGRRTLFLIDEAHCLGVELLEELRTLLNLEGALQMVLFGQPDLLDTLQRPELVSLRQRVAHCLTLEALCAEEAGDYVLHHLRQAGAGANVIGSEALQLLVQACQGVPRLLNQAMTRALRLTAQANAHEVEVEVLLDVLNSLGLNAESANPPVAEPTYRLFAPAHRA